MRAKERERERERDWSGRICRATPLLNRRLKMGVGIIKGDALERSQTVAVADALYFHHDEIDSPVATARRQREKREMKVTGGDAMRR